LADPFTVTSSGISIVSDARIVFIFARRGWRLVSSRGGGGGGGGGFVSRGWRSRVRVLCL
jgi:transcriptional regulator CtsR